ncbi:ABC-type sugar transport system substrate-binding protein [Marmoricola sp. URHA0025 HA25]
MSGYLVRALQLAAGSTALALALSGCGSNANGKDTRVDNAGLDAATSAYAAAAKPPTSIGLDVPLTSAPPVGKKVFFVGNTTPDGERVIDAFNEAAKAVGWTVTRLNYDVSNFASANTAIQQAIQAKADFITYLSVPESVIKSSIADAKAAGIPVFPAVAPEPPSKAAWRFSNPFGSSDFEVGARLNADYVISQSKASGDVLLVNVPSIPGLQDYGDAFAAEMSKNCPACALGHVDVPFSDVTSGAVPAKVVSYLRSHPHVDHVVFAVGAFSTGFPAAASAAGLKLGADGIDVSVFSNGPGNLADIKSGSQQMGLTVGLPWAGWMVVDAMARYSLGMDLDPNWKAVVPLLVQTEDNVGDPNTLWPGPEDYRSQFKRLWQLS